MIEEITMSENIIWIVCVFGCGIIFACIGGYAEKRKQPMWFWTGSIITSDTVSDVKAFNRENAKMWRNYSLPFFASGIVCFYSPLLALGILIVVCTAGIGWLIWTHKKIVEKYKCEPPKTYPKKKKKK